MSELDKRYREAEALKDQGQLPEAIAVLKSILEEDAGHVVSHLALAVLYGRVGEHEEAVQHGQRACELEPTDPFNFTALSVTYQRAWQGTQRQEYIQLAESAMARAHMLEGR